MSDDTRSRMPDKAKESQVEEPQKRPKSRTGGMESSATLDSESMATRSREASGVPGLTPGELKERDAFDAARRKRGEH